VYVVSRKKYKVCLIVAIEKDRTVVDVNLKIVFERKTKVIFPLKG